MEAVKGFQQLIYPKNLLFCWRKTFPRFAFASLPLRTVFSGSCWRRRRSWRRAAGRGRSPPTPPSTPHSATMLSGGTKYDEKNDANNLLIVNLVSREVCTTEYEEECADKQVPRWAHPLLLAINKNTMLDKSAKIYFFLLNWAGSNDVINFVLSMCAGIVKDIPHDIDAYRRYEEECHEEVVSEPQRSCKPGGYNQVNSYQNKMRLKKLGDAIASHLRLHTHLQG